MMNMHKDRPESFKERLSRSYIIIILIMFVLAVLISLASFSRLYYRENINNLRQITTLAVQNIKYEYDDIKRYAFELSNNRTLCEIMADIDFDDMQNVTNSFLQLRRMLENTNYTGSIKKRIIFASDDRDYNYGEFQSEDYFCAANEIDKARLDEPYLKYITENSSKYLLYVQPVFTEFGPERIGNVAIFYDLEKNFKKFSDINASNGGVFFVVDETGKILWHHKKEYILKNIKEESYGEQFFSGKNTFRLKDGSKNYFCVLETIPTTNWKAISIIPTSKFYNNMALYLIVLVTACLAIILLTLSISKRYVRKIIYPVNQICDAMEKTEMINVDDQELFAEFAFIAEQYNSMICRIRCQMNELSKKEIEKRKADMRVLYEQINPHFLYNTLDSINWLAVQSKDLYSKKVVEMVSMLAKMFRISLSKGQETISVAEEIEHVKSYISIQQIRYSDIFTTEYAIDPDILSYRIIKIILQPIVENAIVHGFCDYKGGGLIKISAYGEAEKIIFTVEDNGCGADAEVIKNNLNTPPENEKSGYGLYNIQRRIKLYYGDAYGIDAERSGSGGMKFKITMPKKKGERPVNAI